MGNHLCVLENTQKAEPKVEQLATQKCQQQARTWAHGEGPLPQRMALLNWARGAGDLVRMCPYRMCKFYRKEILLQKLLSTHYSHPV